MYSILVTSFYHFVKKGVFRYHKAIYQQIKMFSVEIRVDFIEE